METPNRWVRTLFLFGVCLGQALNAYAQPALQPVPQSISKPSPQPSPEASTSRVAAASSNEYELIIEPGVEPGLNQMLKNSTRAKPRGSQSPKGEGEQPNPVPSPSGQKEIVVLGPDGRPVPTRRTLERTMRDESLSTTFDYNLRFNLSGWLAGLTGVRLAGLRTGLFQLYLDFGVGSNALISTMVSAVSWGSLGVRASMINIGLRGAYSPWTDRLTSGFFLAGEMSYSLDREQDPVTDPFPVELFLVKGQAGYQHFLSPGVNFWASVGPTVSIPGFTFCLESGVGYAF
jgi:hypothetical protein